MLSTRSTAVKLSFTSAQLNKRVTLFIQIPVDSFSARCYFEFLYSKTCTLFHSTGTSSDCSPPKGHAPIPIVLHPTVPGHFFQFLKASLSSGSLVALIVWYCPERGQ